MTTEVTVRKWGNSLGVILPKEVVEKRSLKENDKIVLIDVVKKVDLTPLFGALKGKIRLSGQQLKDMA
ncbi:MAG: AbrB/MazE/SpoVT family DNA-binding domain-containing protein, partial [Nanoarchaeota archaeon]